jgi:hypothetical protein
MVPFLQYAGGGVMTPEEQFMKIENALRHAAEIQAQHAEGIARNEAAIRDLIIVSRTLVDTAKLHNEAFDRAEEKRERDRADFNVRFNALIQAQLETEQKLQRWIDLQGHA